MVFSPDFGTINSSSPRSQLHPKNPEVIQATSDACGAASSYWGPEKQGVTVKVVNFWGLVKVVLDEVQDTYIVTG